MPTEPDAGTVSRPVYETYLIRVLPKGWRNYIVFSVGLSFGLYLLGFALAEGAGTTTAFFSSAEWDFEPFYLTVHMVVLKLLYDVFARDMPSIDSIFDVTEADLRRESKVIGNSLAAFLFAVPFMAYDSIASKAALEAGGTRALLIVTWNIEWLFFGSIAWFMIGMLLFFGSLERHNLRGNRVEVAMGRSADSIGGVAWTLGAPLVLFELVNTYYFFADGFWPSDIAAFIVVLTLIALAFVVPRAIVGRKLSAAKDAIEEELTSKYTAYVEDVLSGKTPYDAKKADEYRGMRGLLDQKLSDRFDLVKGTLPIALPLVNLALAYFVEHGLGHIPI